MNSYQLAAFSLILGTLTACQSAGTNDKNPLLEEAARYHAQATAIQATLESQLDRIDSLKTTLTAQKTPTALATIQTLDSLKQAFDNWEENLVEVPGMPHDHHHAHGSHEHHHDATLKDLPADQMRDLQRETLASIRQIEARFGDVTTALSR